MTQEKPKPLDLEEIAKLEHDQWVEWSKEISKTEKISSQRLERWKKLWVDYDNLPEDIKEEDRKWARRVISCIKQACEFYLENKDNPFVFLSEHPKYKEELNKLLGVSWQYKIKISAMRDEIVIKYNEWLFKLAFKDVFDDETKSGEGENDK